MQGPVGNHFVEGNEVASDLDLKMKVGDPGDESRLCHIYTPVELAVQRCK